MKYRVHIYKSELDEGINYLRSIAFKEENKVLSSIRKAIVEGGESHVLVKNGEILVYTTLEKKSSN
jgi:hypothetical protein